MNNFIPNKQYLLKILLYLFNIKKSATESNRLPGETYGNNDLLKLLEAVVYIF